jgi:hypothetical protein
MNNSLTTSRVIVQVKIKGIVYIDSLFYNFKINFTNYCITSNHNSFRFKKLGIKGGL